MVRNATQSVTRRAARVEVSGLHMENYFWDFVHAACNASMRLSAYECNCEFITVLEYQCFFVLLLSLGKVHGQGMKTYIQKSSCTNAL